MMEIGCTVKNIQGWQGKVTKLKGKRCLVQYASLAQWEFVSLVYVVAPTTNKNKE